MDVFSEPSASVSTIICGFTERLIHCYDIMHNIVFEKTIHFIITAKQNEYDEVAHV